MFRKDGINLRTSCALVSRLPIYAALRLDSIATFANRGVLTSDSSKAWDTAGARRVSRNLVHSRSSFSPNARRRSAMERSRTTSRDMWWSWANSTKQLRSMRRRLARRVGPPETAAMSPMKTPTSSLSGSPGNHYLVFLLTIVSCCLSPQRSSYSPSEFGFEVWPESGGDALPVVLRMLWRHLPPLPPGFPKTSST